LIQTGNVRHFPVVLVERAYWRGLMDWSRERLIGEGKIAPDDLDLMRLSDEASEVLGIVREGAALQGVAPLGAP